MSDLLRPNEAASYLNMHRVTLHRISERDPDFPRKIKMGARLVYYRKSELDAWLDRKQSSHQAFIDGYRAAGEESNDE